MSESKPSLLIVDDDLGFASNAKQIFEKLGFQVSLSDAKNLESIKDHAPDLLILAAELPKSGNSGYSVCNRLRKEKDFSAMRILITSDGSNEDALNHHTGIEERADAYARKPISDDDLRREVLNLLDDTSIQEDDSVAFISDEEVLEVEAAISSAPPPLPESDLEPWKSIHFDEMVRKGCELEAPVPPKSPDPETRMEYLRARVRFLEEREKATRSAWEIIQEQGKDMERQAAGAKFAAQRQYETLIDTQKQLAQEIENYATFNKKVTAVFEAKDTEEETLKARLEQKKADLQRRQNVVAHLEKQLEDAKKQNEENSKQQAKLEAKLDANRQAHKKETIAITVQAEEEKTTTIAAHQAELAQLKSDFSNEVLLMETEHTGLILEITQEREASLADIQREASNTLVRQKEEDARALKESKLLWTTKTQEEIETLQGQIFLLRTLSENAQAEKAAMRNQLEEAWSHQKLSDETIDSLRKTQSIQRVEAEQLKQEILRAKTRIAQAQNAQLEQNSALHEQQAHVMKLEQELSERYLELEDVQADLSLIEARNEEAQQKQASVSKQWREEQSVNSRLDAQVQTLTTQAAENQKRLQKAEQQLQLKDQAAQKAQELYQSLEERVELLLSESKETKQLKRKYEDLKKQLQLKEDSEKKLQSRIEELDQEREKFHAESKVAAQAGVDLTTELKAQADEISELKSEVIKADRTKEIFEQKLSKAALKNDALTQEIDDLNHQLDERNTAIEQNEEENRLELQKNETLKEKLEENIRTLNTLKREYQKSSSTLEGEISDSQENLYHQLEQVNSLRTALQDAQKDHVGLKSENTTISARLNGAIERIDELENHLFESETRAHQLELELKKAVADRNHARAQLAQTTDLLDDTEKPQKVPNEFKSPGVKKSSQRLSRVLKQAEQAIARELGRRGVNDDSSEFEKLPARPGLNEQKTTTEADLPSEYFEEVARYRSNEPKSDHEYMYLSSEDSDILEIFEDDYNEDDDDTNVLLGNAGIQNTEMEQSRGIQEPVEEDTSPFGELISNYGEVAARSQFVRSHIEDPLAALQALEFSTGNITTPREDDPFVHISELPWNAVNPGHPRRERLDSNEERKITDVLHVDELD